LAFSPSPSPSFLLLLFGMMFFFPLNLPFPFYFSQSSIRFRLLPFFLPFHASSPFKKAPAISQREESSRHIVPLFVLKSLQPSFSPFLITKKTPNAAFPFSLQTIPPPLFPGRFSPLESPLLLNRGHMRPHPLFPPLLLFPFSPFPPTATNVPPPPLFSYLVRLPLCFRVPLLYGLEKFFLTFFHRDTPVSHYKRFTPLGPSTLTTQKFSL